KEVNSALADAKTEAKANLQRRIEAANESANRLAKEIVATKAKESDRIVHDARNNLDAAIILIIERAV
ncbi:MAG: hypothetical protein GX802_07160, partial [Clostridiales bacterium]|nr:hypothetical protein [Clostridiales bacterium]